MKAKDEILELKFPNLMRVEDLKKPLKGKLGGCCFRGDHYILFIQARTKVRTIKVPLEFLDFLETSETRIGDVIEIVPNPEDFGQTSLTIYNTNSKGSLLSRSLFEKPIDMSALNSGGVQ
jgi:hypothetical protein